MKTTLTAAVLAALAGTAHAHVTLEQHEIAAGATGKITYRVPHGCKDAATTALHMKIPEGFAHVKPMPKAGWDLATERTGDAVSEVVWSNGSLPDDFYDEFSLRGTVGGDVAPGPMFFGVEQDCGAAKAMWTDTSADDEIETASPRLIVVAAGAGDGGHDHMAMGADTAPAVTGDAPVYRVGALTVTAPYARATLPGAPVGGGYLSVTNEGASDDRLLSLTSDVADRVQVHSMTMDGSVMKMRPVTGGLTIPAGGTVDLTPAGYHLMFMDLKSALTPGETVEVTLTFETAGMLKVPMVVGAVNARSYPAEK